MAIDWLRNWDEAIKAARSGRRPILIDVYQDQ